MVACICQTVTRIRITPSSPRHSQAWLEDASDSFSQTLLLHKLEGSGTWPAWLFLMTVNENSELRASQDLFAVLAWSPQCLPFDQIPSWHDKEDWRQFLSDVPVQAFQKKKKSKHCVLCHPFHSTMEFVFCYRHRFFGHKRSWKLCVIGKVMKNNIRYCNSSWGQTWSWRSDFSRWKGINIFRPLQELYQIPCLVKSTVLPLQSLERDSQTM